MRHNIRGQGSFEYLINYSWVLVVVLVVGLTFWRIGLLSQNDAPMSSWGFTFFKLVNAVSESRDGLTVLVFQNTQPFPVLFNLTQSSVDCPGIEGLNPLLVVSPTPVPSGAQFKVEIMQCVPPDHTDFGLGLNLIYNAILGGETVEKGESGRVTGKQTVTPRTICTKTDNPSAPTVANLEKKGMTCRSNGCFVDFCIDPVTALPVGESNRIWEFYCPFNQAQQDCPSGKCLDGACV